MHMRVCAHTLVTDGLREEEMEKGGEGRGHIGRKYGLMNGKWENIST